MQANRLPAARGWYWFVGGLRLWQSSPGVVGLAAMLGLLLSGIVGSVPFVGALLMCLIGPFVTVLMLRVCQLVALGRRPAVHNLLAELSLAAIFQSQPRLMGLLILGGVTYIGLLLGEGLLALVAGDAAAQMAAASEAASKIMMGAATDASAPLAASDAKITLPLSVVLAFLLKLLGISMLSIIMWVAPALTAFAGVSAIKSLFFSIVACWRNKAAFFVFGLSLALMSVPLSFLMLLGGFGQTLVIMVLFGVFMPACFASNYLSVTDIFGPLPVPPDAA